jgi:tRNA(His) guanylyltransferase
MLAQAHFKPAQLHGVDSRRMLAMLAEQRGVDWEQTPPFFRYGTYVKKEEYSKPALNPKTGEAVVARRTRASARSFELDDASAAGFLLEKTWPAEALAGERPDGGPCL